MVLGARQSFQFFREIAWFLENNRDLELCFNVGIGFCMT